MSSKGISLTGLRRGTGLAGAGPFLFFQGLVVDLPEYFGDIAAQKNNHFTVLHKSKAGQTQFNDFRFSFLVDEQKILKN